MFSSHDYHITQYDFIDQQTNAGPTVQIAECVVGYQLPLVNNRPHQKVLKSGIGILKEEE